MVKFGRAVAKGRVFVLLLAIALMIPSVLGIAGTRINYDILKYLPDDMDTVTGQNILLDDFGKGAFSMVIVEGMDTRQVVELKDEFEKIDHVESVVWYNSLASTDIPMEMLPKKYYDEFNKGDATLMAVFFDSATSADETISAIQQMRKVAGEKCFIAGMSALVTDLKELCEKEEPVYVALAVALACAAMMIFMDSWLIPFLFLISIGMAIVLNLGTNYFLGEISYITKALSAVLQLAVTMDYSIFLWHSYCEQRGNYDDHREAMAQAISKTFTAVLGSSVTTIAGFLALCFMSFTLGADLGIVMAKGVLLGVIGCVTTLPALILIFDKPIQKSRHRSLLPKMDKAARLITEKPAIFIGIFLVVLVPSLYGYTHASVYYDMSNALPDNMPYVIANEKLQNDFDMASTHMILCRADMTSKDAQAMLKEIEAVPGVQVALGEDSLKGSAVPEDVLPDDVKDLLKTDKWQLMLINSEYYVSSDEENDQITQINAILKRYDPDGMLIGEGPCTKDLIDVTDHDFSVVSAISIIAIFIIIAVVLKSASLPFILVAVIEFAIFINLGIPFYTHVSLPFVAPICISTIQLGSTVDYAILMTTRYRDERSLGLTKHEAVNVALSTSIPSVLVSALGFFAATFGVALYSNIDIISSMCTLMARGAIVSMLSVIFILPSMFLVFDHIICKTSRGFLPAAVTEGKKQ